MDKWRWGWGQVYSDQSFTNEWMENLLWRPKYRPSWSSQSIFERTTLHSNPIGTLNRDFNNHCESNLESFPWNLSFFLFLIATQYNLKPHRITAVSINSDPIKSTSQALETLSGTRSMLCQSKWQQQEESIQYSDFNWTTKNGGGAKRNVVLVLFLIIIHREPHWDCSLFRHTLNHPSSSQSQPS